MCSSRAFGRFSRSTNSPAISALRSPDLRSIACPKRWTGSAVDRNGKQGGEPLRRFPPRSSASPDLAARSGDGPSRPLEAADAARPGQRFLDRPRPYRAGGKELRLLVSKNVVGAVPGGWIEVSHRETTLSAGSRLGPYEIVSPLGGGGRGRCTGRRTRLGREVAVKVLPSDFSADRDRLRRFEQEAHARFGA